MKVCTKCNKNRDVSDFYKDKRKKDGIQSSCKFCARQYASNSYYGNLGASRISAAQRRAMQRESRRTEVFNYLKTHPCVDCGESNLIVLEFDHVRGEKLQDVSKLVGWGISSKKLEDEIKKCDVVCANCHRKRTYQRSGSYRLQWQVSKSL